MFSCDFSGQCIEHAQGPYSSREECQAQCQGAPAKDLLYSIYSYNLEEALTLPYTDQYQVIRLFTGTGNFDPLQSEEILTALVNHQYLLLARLLPEYVATFPPLDQFLLRIFSFVPVETDFSVVKEVFLEHQERSWHSLTVQSEREAMLNQLYNSLALGLTTDPRLFNPENSFRQQVHIRNLLLERLASEGEDLLSLFGLPPALVEWQRLHERGLIAVISRDVVEPFTF